MASNRTDWWPASNYGTDLNVTEDNPTVGAWTPVFILMGMGRGFEGSVAVGAADQHEFQANESLTFLRAVGRLTFRTGVFAGGTEILVHERIHSAIQDPNNGSIALAVDLDTEAGSEEPFLWERVSYMEPSTEYPANGTDFPYWTGLDLRVKRRLNRTEALVYSIAFSPFVPAEGQFILRHYVRVLGRR